MDIKELKDKINEISASEREIARPRQRIRRSPLAKLLVLRGENLKEFEDLRENFFKEAKPHTEIETFLCEKIISAMWELRRIAEVKRNVMNGQNAISEAEEYGMSDAPARKRVRNIKRVRFDAEVQQLIQYQIELEKLTQKWLGRLHEEQGTKGRRTIKKS